MNKYLDLMVYCSRYPCTLTMINESGDSRIFNIQSSQTHLSFCTNSDNIWLIATYEGITIYKKICLCYTCCQRVDISFVFNSAVIPRPINVTTLTDANYGFLVAEAVLNFQS